MENLRAAFPSPDGLNAADMEKHNRATHSSKSGDRCDIPYLLLGMLSFLVFQD